MNNDSGSGQKIAQTAVRGSAYSIAASLVTLTLGFARAVIMARLLLPEHFGVTALALFYINLAAQFRALGIDSAIIHRRETSNELLGSYFSLRMGLMVASFLILAALTPLIGRFHNEYPLLIGVIFAFMVIEILKVFNAIDLTMLSRRMAFREQAIADVASSIVMTITGPTMAYFGFGLWSIVAERGSGILIRTILFWFVFRVWRPIFGWDRETVRWLIDYGSKMWAVSNLNFLLSRFDDWWVGTVLGSTPLGYYSRAYEFAGYSRRAVANPLMSVFLPTFSHLQNDRLRLSQAFFRVNSLMIRVGGLVSLIFVLSAPEFIALFLGDKWLPMVLTFQLMILYVLLDPLVMGVNNLMAATGQPGTIIKSRLLQAVVFIPAVIVLGLVWGINGVALAADLMILVGYIQLIYLAGQVVDFSIRQLWLWPLVATFTASSLILLLQPLWQQWSLWAVLTSKIGLGTAVYGLVLVLAERNQLLDGAKMIWVLLQRKHIINPKNKS